MKINALWVNVQVLSVLVAMEQMKHKCTKSFVRLWMNGLKS